MTPEGRVKANVKKILDKYKKQVWYFMPVSGGMGQHGIPDFICCVSGMFFAIECKATQDLIPTALQSMQLTMIRNVGGVEVTVGGPCAPEIVERYIQMILTRTVGILTA